MQKGFTFVYLGAAIHQDYIIDLVGVCIFFWVLHYLVNIIFLELQSYTMAKPTIKEQINKLQADKQRLEAKLDEVKKKLRKLIYTFDSAITKEFKAEEY